ncbi:mitochondrial carnitine/acylcarnitine carrier protein [Ophiocordyceps camponoti-floridani]|uniref:Mitochondrial carnitine/acylcarnitine carrier protein n=1 Tax=Ophiocordyceps camponoti-floridani TaxID=2030778 RepID=A0A8H4Q7K8_9HYPO|nr:mitochondrial carnitine/acylcarnitine carrier protein [Ophiocordyceps camponoti-floridani]
MEPPSTSELVEPVSGVQQTAKDLFSGAMGGIAQVLIGQPFDIIKVRLQTTDRYTGAFNAATSIYRSEGPLAFYKGTLTPLLGIGACVSIQFGAFHATRRWFQERNNSHEATPALTSTQNFTAGAIAGIANAALSGPIEHVRIRLQSQPHGPTRLYDGPWDCSRKLASRAGGLLPALYRGQTVTLLREASAYGAWFATFEALIAEDVRRNALPSRHDVPAWKVALYGGLAGEALWLASYPFDVVKSRMQTDGFGAEAKFPTMRSCVASTWREGGFAGFWRGIWPTLFRAMPVSAGTFAVVEMTRRAID